MNRRAQFDTGPLSWVKSEIDLAMQQGLAALRAFAAGDAAQIRPARAQLHQAHGALQIVGLDGMTRVSAELEALLADIEAGAQPSAIAAAENGFEGIMRYLDGLMAGRAHQALRLMPLYRDMRAARSGEAAQVEADPLDLYFPKTDFLAPWREKPPVQLHSEETARYFREQRLHFQRGFIVFLKGDAAGLKELLAAVQAVESAVSEPKQRAFWWAALAATEALVLGAAEAVPPPLQRRVCSRIEGQLRRLTEGVLKVDELALREVLYLLAHARPASESIRQAQQGCALAETVPQDEQAAAEEPVALRPAREQLETARECWSHYAADTTQSEALQAFARAAAAHARHADELGSPDLAALARALERVGEALLADPSRMSEAVALEAATALLLQDNALQTLLDGPGLGEAFAEQSRFLCERLEGAIEGNLIRTAPDIPLLDEMSRQAQEQLVMEQLVTEMKSNLRQIEEVLDRFFRDPTSRDSLASTAEPLQKLGGALRTLGDQRAGEALAVCEAMMVRFADSGQPARQEDFEQVAQILSALGFHIEALARGETSDFEAVLHPRRAAPVEEMPAPQQTPQPLSDEAVDAELLAVFMEEAEEVLATMSERLAHLSANPADHDALVAIRRGFHTLKGSGRMVGLHVMGEAAWTAEQALNWWLREPRPASAAVLALVEGGRRYFGESVAALKSGAAAGDASALATLAEAVKKGPATAPAITPDAAAIAASAAAMAEAAASSSRPAEGQADTPAVDDASGDRGEEGDDGDTVQLGEGRISTTVFTLFSGEAHALMNTLRAEQETLQNHGIITDEMLRAAHTLGGISGTVGLEGLSALGYGLERALEQLAQDAVGEDEQALVAEAVETLGGMVETAIELRVPPAAHALMSKLERLAQPPAQEHVPTVFVSDPDALLPEEEGALHEPPPVPVPVSAYVADPDALLPEEEGAMHVAPPSPQADAAPSTPPAATPQDSAARPLQRRDQRLRDELDPQLLPLFLEEADELMPAVAEDLRNWRTLSGDAAAALARALQRRLHTLKGSARMAGAMAVGDLAHSMETKVEAVANGTAQARFDELDSSFDRLEALMQGLRQPQAAEAEQAEGSPAVEESTAPGATLLRVRAELVDRLVDQTGEVSIARSRIETELRGLKSTMQELTDNVLRLRSQLREIEIQAESQMQAAATDVRGKEGFDPLEFDRFTRFQELTRIMAESVNDVQTVHQNLLRSVEGTDAALAVQARLNRELQQELMRIRMVAFGTLSERLHRVVRQTAKEAGKRANLDIRGASVELDRAVLERITAPVEHVLRNAVIHGLESPASRAAAGKPDIGDIRIEVSQESSEIRLSMVDDGAGLELERIRAKALERGLLAAGAQPSEAELADFIFHPGFSTAAELTQSAGRGVGMDVVRTEVAALGGRVELVNAPGKGLTLTIFLPLTLAVTQVVLVRVREQLFALPAVIVEQVMQYRPEQLAAQYAAGQAEWRGRRYPLHYLPHLLGNAEVKPEARRLAAVMLLRSGASAMALHVDEIVGGNQEVVVKAIGPQLQQVPGIAGATVLGSGEIVLIVNPVPLAGRIVAPPPVAAATAAAELPPLVLVVDDSLTVRKITGRLLERQGWSVATARDGVEALEKLVELRPDVALLDIEMPRMDGFELTRHIRADAALAGLPIIMISSRTADKHQNHARELGVDAFLGKPYQEDQLLERIRQFLKRNS